MTTELLFRDDATRLQATATIVAVDDHGIVLDRTVFYPQGGGQAGDAGTITAPGGAVLAVVDTRKHPTRDGDVAHVPAPGFDAAAFTPGSAVELQVDGARRRAHMRLHTATHLLCALVPYPVDGCSITAAYARLDFHTAEPIDKDALNAGLARHVAAAVPVRSRWIDDAELDANPQLVRSMRVKPPRGSGRVRVIDVAGIDQQPCGGTHVANTADIGPVIVTKVEKKSAMTRRVILGFAEPGASPG